MYYIPRIEPISNLVRDTAKFLGTLNGGPVHLTQRGREAAVILSAAEWRQLVEHLEALEAVIEMHKAEQRGHVDRMSPEEVDQWVAE